MSTRVRVSFFARPIGDTPPKILADEESFGAAWIGLDELPLDPLRGDEVLDLIEYVHADGPVLSVSLIQQEGMPFYRDDRK
jgi:phosphatase NudJ